VSFTFGTPARDVADRLHAAGSEVWVTVTNPADARTAVASGADVLVVQGVEAGGHRGTFADEDGAGEIGLLALLQLVRAEVGVPLVATGGIATGAAVAAVLAAGARAAQLGTAFALTPEAATSAAQRDVLGTPRPTGLTRAFTGRLARGIVNRFQAEHSRAAPSAYPELHHVTAPLRARARQAGDAEAINLWAGQAHELTRAVPAAQLVAELAAGARAALDAARF
jgi:nitronate monooxygenase